MDPLSLVNNVEEFKNYCYLNLDSDTSTLSENYLVNKSHSKGGDF